MLIANLGLQNPTTCFQEANPLNFPVVNPEVLPYAGIFCIIISF